jgi:predicted peroxiredoxin
MQVITAVGPDDVTKVGLPFVAAMAAAEDGDEVDFFLTQEGAYMGSSTHTDWSGLQSPGLPPVDELFETVREHDALRDFVVCEPCTDPRGIDGEDLREFARFGGPEDLTMQANRNETTITF